MEIAIRYRVIEIKYRVAQVVDDLGSPVWVQTEYVPFFKYMELVSRLKAVPGFVKLDQKAEGSDLLMFEESKWQDDFMDRLQSIFSSFLETYKGD